MNFKETLLKMLEDDKLEVKLRSAVAVKKIQEETKCSDLVAEEIFRVLVDELALEDDEGYTEELAYEIYHDYMEGREDE